MDNPGVRHLSEDQLLRYVDGELPAREREGVRQHLEACWQCRAELEGLERIIGDCVAYRKSVLETCLPPPPEPWFDIERRFDQIDAAAGTPSLATRALDALRALAGTPRRWTSVAVAALLVFVIIRQWRQVPAVKAAELLRRAVVAAESRPRAPRRIQIRTRGVLLTRRIGAAAPLARTAALAQTGEDSTAVLEALFREAHYDWEDPLSAKSYARWREQLPEKQDEVTTIHDSQAPNANRYRIRTTTGSGELVEASLTLREPDLRAVEGTLQFRHREPVEIMELSEDSPAENAAESAAIAPARPAPSPRPVEIRVAKPALAATPGEELQVVAVLHRLGADLGDPVEITRSGGRILVTGVGLGAARQQEIREQLRPLPRVVVQFSNPDAQELRPEDRAAGGISVRAAGGPLQLEMENHLGGRAAFEQFADQVLERTDAFMSRAHALRRLAERFPSAIEALMTPDERSLLHTLGRQHVGALFRDVTAIQERIAPVLLALGAPADSAPALAPAAGSWQDAAEELFANARGAEALLIAMLGGATAENQTRELPVQTAARLAQLRAGAVIQERLFGAR